MLVLMDQHIVLNIPDISKLISARACIECQKESGGVH